MNGGRKIETGAPKGKLPQFVVLPDRPISDCIAILDRVGMGVLAVCDENLILVGLVTDGDIRRALLRKQSLDQPCINIAGTNPLTAPAGISESDALHLMNHGKPFLVNHLPLLDKEGRLIDLLLRSDLQSTDPLDVHAVVVAGGFGKRLWPLTHDTPKPLLQVGNRPVMEHIIAQLRDAGIRHVNVTTHFKAEKIRGYFGDGRAFGVAIEYVAEDQPLGTAGALSLMQTPEQPLLVVNGDILTKVDYRAMLAFHREHNADLTIGVRQYDLKVPYGVLECEGVEVRQLREKPTFKFIVNAGIYLLEPTILHYIPRGERFDMTDLIERLMAEDLRVVSFPIIEYWMDIGQLEDYEQACEDMAKGI